MFKGTQNTKGSSKQIGNISDNKLALLTTIPVVTLRQWKKTNKDNWRYKIYMSLKAFDVNKLKEFISNGERL